MATATQDRPKTRTQDVEAAAKAKDKEKAAKAKEKEKAAKAKEKEKAAKAKEKERLAKQKDKERAAKAKEKERLAKQKDKERAAKAKEKEKAAKAKEKDRAAKEKDRAAAHKDGERATKATRSGAGTGPKSRGGSSRPAGGSPRSGSPKPTVHASGWIAEELGRADAVTRSTKRPTLAASFTTRDHDVIRRWAESRGGVPADVRGTGDGNDTGGAGVLRIEFRDEADRLEDVSWDAFFATFDDSDVDFLYQEFTKDGGESRFHKIVRADA
ncbi:MAG: hypothetical protein JWN17_2733 [Frankiales bacterium]|nr:hypothetical protein [Frankiales bacterium]